MPTNSLVLPLHTLSLKGSVPSFFLPICSKWTPDSQTAAGPNPVEMPSFVEHSSLCYSDGSILFRLTQWYPPTYTPTRRIDALSHNITSHKHWSATITDAIITILRRSYCFRHVLSNQRIHGFANLEGLMERRGHKERNRVCTSPEGTHMWQPTHTPFF